MPLLRKSDAAEYTRKVAESYRRSAIEAISGFAPSSALESLKTIADFAVDRRSRTSGDLRRPFRPLNAFILSSVSTGKQIGRKTGFQVRRCLTLVSC